MSNRLIICCGMLRSASTWQYQIVTELGELSGNWIRGGFCTVNEYQQLVEKHPDSSFIIKTHEYHPFWGDLLSTGFAKGVYSYRDIRDVICSLMWKNNESLENLFEYKLLDGIIDSFYLWTSFGEVVVQDYEYIIQFPEKCIAAISKHLNFPISLEIQKDITKKYSRENNLRKTRVIKEKYKNKFHKSSKNYEILAIDPETLLHWNHIREEKQTWNNLLSSKEIELVHSYPRVTFWLDSIGFIEKERIPGKQIVAKAFSEVSDFHRLHEISKSYYSTINLLDDVWIDKENANIRAQEFEVQAKKKEEIISKMNEDLRSLETARLNWDFEKNRFLKQLENKDRVLNRSNKLIISEKLMSERYFNSLNLEREKSLTLKQELFEIKHNEFKLWSDLDSISKSLEWKIACIIRSPITFFGSVQATIPRFFSNWRNIFSNRIIRLIGGIHKHKLYRAFRKIVKKIFPNPWKRMRYSVYDNHSLQFKVKQKLAVSEMCIGEIPETQTAKSMGSAAIHLGEGLKKMDFDQELFFELQHYSLGERLDE